MPDTHHKRVFFALWPDESLRDSIYKIYQKSIYKASSGQVHQRENFHLTLHFLGSLTPSQVDCALQQAEKVVAEKFELTLDSFACFEKAKILYLGPTEIPPQLSELYEKLTDVLSVCEVPLESRGYQPHVTLIRKFKGFQPSEVSQKVHWEINKFALLESISTANGVQYKPLQFFPLLDHTQSIKMPT